jgi:GDP-4-dehydro-6-deoxy-D-mannose reductase
VNATGRLTLVTGGSGFAGSHLVERLLSSQPQVAAWRSTAAREPARDPRVLWQTVDLLDRAAVERALEDVRPSIIFHLAGAALVAESWQRSARALEVNALGTHHLLDAVERVVPDGRVIVAGSALVYRASATALSEDAAIGPGDPYGVSKLAQEMLAERAPLPVVRTRPFNHIGPRQSDAFVTSSFARQIAEIERGARGPELLVGNLDARRDMMDVRDTARAYEALAQAGVPGRVYNICSGTAHRVGDLLECLLRMARTRVTVRIDPARLRPSDNPVVLGDFSRLEADTGWRPSIPIETTLADLLGWWRERLASMQ